MHPIHYSLILNVVTLIAAGALSWQQHEPVWLIIAIMLLNHTIGRFASDETQPSRLDDDDDDPKIGFGADIR
jgi:hypothetical protein